MHVVAPLKRTAFKTLGIMRSIEPLEASPLLDSDALLRIISHLASSAVCGAPHTAEFETNWRKERQAEGIAAAKARGVYKGRKPKIDPAIVHKLRYERKLGPADIARRLGIGRASVYRVLGKKGAA